MLDTVTPVESIITSLVLVQEEETDVDLAITS